MQLFVTADLHLNHKNIIKYCNRPFKNVEHMNEKLIANINSRCKEDDLLWHLGDLMYAKSTQADVIHTFKDIIEQIKPHLYFIRGNHDQNNGGKNLMLYSVMMFANKKYLFTHIPPGGPMFIGKYYISDSILSSVDCILCGHVHGNWEHRYYEIYGNKIPIINVGVDVRNFMPIKMSEIDVIYQRLKRNSIEK